MTGSITCHLTGNNARRSCGDAMVMSAGDAIVVGLMRSITRLEVMTIQSVTSHPSIKMWRPTVTAQSQVLRATPLVGSIVNEDQLNAILDSCDQSKVNRGVYP